MSMGYQVNFRLALHDCDYWQTEAVTELQAELLDAIKLVFERHRLSMPVTLSSAEVFYLTK